MNHKDAKRRRKAIAQWRRKHKATVHDTARQFGVSVGLVRDACKENGYRVKYARPLPDLSTYVALRRLFLDRATMSAVARELGVTRQRIYTIKQRAISAGWPAAGVRMKVRVKK